VIVGLTGGICTGKSIAAAQLELDGAHVIDCDAVSHHLTNCSPELRNAIRLKFGSEMFHVGGALLRRRLADLIFADTAARLELEAILHPPILKCVEVNIAAARSRSEHLVVVVPLLFELGIQEMFDEVWLVTCEPGTQLERLMNRSGLDLATAERWVAAQVPQAVKARQAKVILPNDDTIESFRACVSKRWEGVLSS
jgi:dephospho-CoA kinase